VALTLSLTFFLTVLAVLNGKPTPLRKWFWFCYYRYCCCCWYWHVWCVIAVARRQSSCRHCRSPHTRQRQFQGTSPLQFGLSEWVRWKVDAPYLQRSGQSVCECDGSGLHLSSVLGVVSYSCLGRWWRYSVGLLQPGRSLCLLVSLFGSLSVSLVLRLPQLIMFILFYLLMFTSC